MAGSSRGTLSTLAVDPAGYPFGSVATYALDDGGNPLFFVSLMAEHTQNALRDPRASLMVAEPVPEGADPLASGRVTVLGDLAEVADGDGRALVRDRYLEANPASAYYIDFGDFTFYRLDVRAVRYVGGYGRMSWIESEAFAAAEADPLAAYSAGIVAHMNDDHADAMVLLCRTLGALPGTVGATMSAVDRYGFEMIAVTGTDRTAVRLGFPAPVGTSSEARGALVDMVRAARVSTSPPHDAGVPTTARSAGSSSGWRKA